MTYNPDVHHRKSIRLKDYDYSQNGMYFITICTKNRENIFWNLNKNNDCRGGACSAQKPDLNYLGKIVQKEWLGLTQRFQNVQLGEYIIMPNHFHGILILEDFVDLGGASPAPTIGNIISAFKSISTISCNKIDNIKGRIIWQRNYYEHIIRNENELYKIIEYIKNNPYNWENDPNYINL